MIKCFTENDFLLSNICWQLMTITGNVLIHYITTSILDPALNNCDKCSTNCYQLQFVWIQVQDGPSCSETPRRTFAKRRFVWKINSITIINRLADKNFVISFAECVFQVRREIHGQVLLPAERWERLDEALREVGHGVSLRYDAAAL